MSEPSYMRPVGGHPSPSVAAPHDQRGAPRNGAHLPAPGPRVVPSARSLEPAHDRVRRGISQELQRLARRAEHQEGPHLSEVDQRLAARARGQQEVENWNAEAIERGIEPLDPQSAARLIDRVVEAVLYGAAGFTALLTWPGATDIFVNGFDDVRVRLEDGSEVDAQPFVDSDDALIEFIRLLAERHGHQEREFHENAPLLELQLIDAHGVKARLTAGAYLSPRPFMAIRRYLPVDLTLDELYQRGEFDYGLRTLLGAAWRAGMKIVVTGAMGAGKTTLIRAICYEAPADRYVVLEDAPELQLGDSTRLNHVIELVSRLPNSEGVGEKTLADLGRFNKRLQPDRVVVGEVRGEEVLALFQIMSDGVPGMCTIHAGSSDDMFSRLPLYAPSWRPDLLQLHAAKALDWVVVLGEDWAGRKVVSEAHLVEEYDPEIQQVRTHAAFVQDPRTGRAEPNPVTGLPPDVERLLKEYGYRPDRHHMWAVDP